MSQRNFDNFLEAYVNYADNKFAPRAFHVWAGLSILSAALERKVWVPINHTKNLYPNIYVFLVSLPGAGKSSALDRAADFVHDHNLKVDNPIKIIPNQVTEQKLIDLMTAQKQFKITDTKFVFHSSAFYPASEASNCLKVLQGGGDIVPTLTDFYDCPSVWKKATLKDGERTLTNLCFSLVAGCTYDYLGKLITGDSIFGGFASRVIYVVHGGKSVRAVKWQDGETEDRSVEFKTRLKLLEDYGHIAELRGGFKADAGFITAYEEGCPRLESIRQTYQSEKMQSLLVRKPVNVMKVAALLSVAESSDLVLRKHHWEGALKLIDDVETELPGMLREAKSGQVSSQEGLIQAILRNLEIDGAIVRTDLQSRLILKGFDSRKIESTITALINNNAIQVTVLGDRSVLKLLIDPNAHL